MNKTNQAEDIGQLVFHKDGIYITPVRDTTHGKFWLKFDSFGKRIGLYDWDIQEKVGK